MFRVHFLLFFLLSSAFVPRPKAEFFFEKDHHRFPKTMEGEQLSHTYVFRNVGGEPLIITDYLVNCVCTKVKFPLKPVLPGATDSILVTFDTNAKSGYHDRVVEIHSNAINNPYQLRFRVFVQKNR